jgi:hypothetical protein
MKLTKKQIREQLAVLKERLKDYEFVIIKYPLYEMPECRCCEACEGCACCILNVFKSPRVYRTCVTTARLLIGNGYLDPYIERYFELQCVYDYWKERIKS